jgi:3-oxoacyl-[acyl-carrier protein] reductase
VHNIQSFGAEAIAIQGDMSKLADIQHLFTEVKNKFAADQFTMSLAKELGSRGITANNVALGLTRTEGLEKSPPREIREKVEPQISLGRLGEPEDIADIVAFLCSHDGRWITSQIIRATGGLV